MKQYLLKYISELGHEVTDLGVDSADVPSDYPDAAELVGLAITGDRADRGILVCGSGVGVSIAANKMDGVYAALCHDPYSASQGVEHDRMNVLCIGERVVGMALAELLVSAFLDANPSWEERHARRFEKVLRIEATHGT
jgi:ribose 5-phosphate isomerase B